MKFLWAAESLLGTRHNNQDRVCMLYTPEAVLLLVADGMGGHLHGEWAAQVVVDVLAQLFALEARPALADPARFLAGGLEAAHQRIVELALQRRFPEVPCSTAVAAVLQDGQLYWAHAGDSRLYVLEQGGVQVRTVDHSVVQRLLEQGVIGPDELKTHPERNRIYSCLGGFVSPEVTPGGPLELEVGSTVLLCSDGLWSQMGDDELVRAFSARPANVVLGPLCRVAERRADSHCDNLSAVALTLLLDEAQVTSVSGFVDTAEAAPLANARRAMLESSRLAQRSGYGG